MGIMTLGEEYRHCVHFNFLLIQNDNCDVTRFVDVNLIIDIPDNIEFMENDLITLIAVRRAISSEVECRGRLDDDTVPLHHKASP